MLLVGVLSANGGLTWTDKALQLKQAQTRVIDMNAIPEKKSPYPSLRCIIPKLFMELLSHCEIVEPFNIRNVYSILLIFPAGLGCDKEKR